VVACVSTATLLRVLLQPVLGAQAVFLLAVLAVALSAHLAGFLAGLATTVLAVPIAALLFMPAPGPTARRPGCRSSCPCSWASS